VEKKQVKRFGMFAGGRKETANKAPTQQSRFDFHFEFLKRFENGAETVSFSTMKKQKTDVVISSSFSHNHKNKHKSKQTTTTSSSIINNNNNNTQNHCSAATKLIYNADL
jgi:hypothetical protein